MIKLVLEDLEKWLTVMKNTTEVVEAETSSDESETIMIATRTDADGTPGRIGNLLILIFSHQMLLTCLAFLITPLSWTYCAFRREENDYTKTECCLIM